MDYNNSSPVGSLIGLIIAVVLFGIPLYQMALRKGMKDMAWMAWVPIADLFLLLKLAGKPLWWFILLLIPLVNIVVIVMVGMSLCENFGYNKWLGLLMLIGPLNLILLYVMAFSGHKPPAPLASPPSSPMPPAAS